MSSSNADILTVDTNGRTRINEFESLISDTKTPVFVMVSATWCNPCRLIKPEFINRSQTDSKKATFIIVDADECEDICKKYNILTIPTILVFKNSSLQVVDKFSGSNTGKFNEFIDKHIDN
jgi:thioredoxin 1